MSLKSMFSAKDMTMGSPWKRILEFSIPMLLGNIAQQLYNTADSVIVGMYVGDNALAAVGSASPILNLLLALFVGIATGAGIVVSHHHGMVQYSVPPLMVLQDIISAVGSDVEIFVDCGIVSGMDAYKCLALGAKAVSVGRHLMPLLKQGPEVVSQRINAMNAELAGIMARTGVKSLDDMDASIIHRRAF